MVIDATDHGVSNNLISLNSLANPEGEDEMSQALSEGLWKSTLLILIVMDRKRSMIHIRMERGTFSARARGSSYSV